MEILPPTRFDVISVKSTVAAHKQLQSSPIDCLIIDNLNTIDVPINEILSLITASYSHPIILIDGTPSEEIPTAYRHCRVVNSDHLDALPEKIEALIEQRNLEAALSDHNELQHSVIEILHDATNATNEDEINSLVFEELQKSGLFDYIWLGNYDTETNDVSIKLPSEGTFPVETVSDILQINDMAIFDKAVQSSELQSTTSPVKTRETAQYNVDSTNPSYQLNTLVIPIQSCDRSGDLMILATYRTGAFDTAEKQLLSTLRDVLKYFKSTVNQKPSEPDQPQEEIDTFVATLVHELRSPLGIAQAFLDIGRNDGDDAQDALEKVAGALDDLEHTIDNLASMAKNNMTVEVEEVELEPLVREVWESLDTKDDLIQIESSIYVTADPALLKILFRNLLSNAIQHGGENSTIQVGSLNDGFFVEDTGSGIPTEIQDEIFSRGFSDAGGLGVGLALVNDIVDAHGWEITINSEVGRGTSVEITNVTMRVMPVEE